jgi:hypothetical protein
MPPVRRLVLVEIPDLDAAEKDFAESLRIWEKNYGRDYPGAQIALGRRLRGALAGGGLCV